jgi:hypothetical protein
MDLMFNQLHTIAAEMLTSSFASPAIGATLGFRGLLIERGMVTANA